MAEIVHVKQIKRVPGKLTKEGQEFDLVWIVTFDEMVTQGTAIYLCVTDADGRFPLPYQSAMGSALCESLEATPVQESSRMWRITARFAALNNNNPKPPNAEEPYPNSPTPPVTPVTNFDDWIPTLSRFPRTVAYPATKAFYLGGYNLDAHADLIELAGDPAESVPIVTSAGQRMIDTPDAIRHQAEWVIRWYTSNPDESVFTFEGSVNDDDISFSLRGFEWSFLKHTARLEGVTISEVFRGASSRWEISLSILHDQIGFEYELADRGTMRRIKPGVDKNDYEVVLASALNTRMTPIRDREGRAFPEPIALNGNGQPATETYQTAYSRWLNETERNWSAMPYFSNLVVTP